jgi:Leucine-rich repeat (LRR) protein
LTHSQKLTLRNCDELRDLPPEIGKLSQLQDRIVSGCSLTELRVPEEIGGLPKIRHLHFSRCMNLPPQIVKLKTLEDLDLSFYLPPHLGKIVLSESKAFNDLSEEEYASMGIGELLALEYLDLSYCIWLERDPPKIFDLSSLAALTSTGCSMLFLPGLESSISLSRDASFLSRLLCGLFQPANRNHFDQYGPKKKLAILTTRACTVPS